MHRPSKNHDNEITKHGQSQQGNNHKGHVRQVELITIIIDPKKEPVQIDKDLESEVDETNRDGDFPDDCPAVGVVLPENLHGQHRNHFKKHSEVDCQPEVLSDFFIFQRGLAHPQHPDRHNLAFYVFEFPENDYIDKESDQDF